MLQKSEAFNKLDLKIQKWLIAEGWKKLFSIQEFSINKIIKDPSDANNETVEDLILFAPTAGGKTMAAFLPLMHSLYKQKRVGNDFQGYEIIYICPTRALIQQQSSETHDLFRLGKILDITVNPWMGDIGTEIKEKSWNNPQGILIITPESLEGRFTKRPFEIKSRFANLKAIVIDELHAYFESERGPQLISLLTRLDNILTERKIQRIGLSATLGDGAEDSERIFRFMRPGLSAHKFLHAQNKGDETKFDFDINLSIHQDNDLTDFGTAAREEIAKEIRKIYDQAKAGIVFTNSRREAERYTNLLNTKENELKRLPDNWGKRITSFDEDFEYEPGDINLQATNIRTFKKGSKLNEAITEEELKSISKGSEKPLMDKPFEVINPLTDKRRYWPHHGSLNKTIRTHVERRMRISGLPCILVATTTLELGIDVGEVKEVVQIGAGSSVASLRQRLGRSGRPERKDGIIVEATKPKLHLFIREASEHDNVNIINRLMLASFQTLAQVALLREGKFESPRLDDLHLSTFTQQLLSLIHQSRENGITIAQAKEILIENGPFGALTDSFYAVDSPVNKTVFDAVIERLRTRYPALIDLDIADQEDQRELFLTDEGNKLVAKNYFLASFKSRQEYTIKTTTSKQLGSIGLGINHGTGDKIIFGGYRWKSSE